MRSIGPTLGADPIAAVLGGICLLAIFAVALILRRDHLRNGIALGSRAWIASGAVGGVLLYLAGLLILGRFEDLQRPSAWVDSFPWALLLVMLVGAGVSYVTGARAGWHWAGVGLFSSLVLASVGWGAYLMTTRVGDLVDAPSLSRAALVALLFAQLLALTLVCAASAYMVDGLTRRRWVRAAADATHDPEFQPVVAVHVACYDEPYDIVVRTLDSLVAQDYPREKLHIMLVDDTTRPEDVRALRAACEERGVAFVHRDERKGYKAGALNFALRHTPEDAKVIAVVDADFVCEPNFIRDNVGYFADPRLAFLQTRLDYSNADASFTARYATLLENYFYASMMHTRNEADAILFAGTMGMLRRSAVESVGGWTDGHVGEDVDLSCRLLLRGWKSLYVPRVFGRGLQTPDQEAFRRQQMRWAYGGARIMRDHGKAILTGHMSAGQKAHYLYGPLFWLDGSLGLLFATAMAAFALAFIAGQTAFLPARELVFVGLVPILIIMESLVRSAFTMRRVMGLTARETGALVLLGWSGKLMNATAAWAALLGKERPFHRTPKGQSARMTRTEAAKRAVQVAPIETGIAAVQAILAIAMGVTLAASGTAGLPATLLVGAIMMAVLWALYFGAAPLCVYLGYLEARAQKVQRPSGSPLRRPTRAG